MPTPQQTPPSADLMPTSALVQKHFVYAFNEGVLAPEDLAFTHSIFVQCFLPMRSLPGHKEWQVTHGKASLMIEAGRLVDPNSTGRWKQYEVPAGPKARLLFAYINDFAIRHKTSIIDLGRSLRHFMDKNKVPIGGKNGRELARQLRNIAASRILLGTWSGTHASTEQIRIAKRVDFWLEPDARQASLWQPEMHLSPEYFEGLNSHRMPLPFRALVSLQANPRAMDVFCWLVYRMRSVKRPLKIPYAALHPIFGAGIARQRDFKAHFRKAVLLAHPFYPEAMIRFGDKVLETVSVPPAHPKRCLEQWVDWTLLSSFFRLLCVAD